MADSHHIIDGKVVPYSGGRKCNDTDAWRDATPLELQLQEQLEEYEHANAAQAAEIEALRAQLDEQCRLHAIGMERELALITERDRLRGEVERANCWNERVSVCRDHVADIVDGPCVICALDAAEARAERLAETLRPHIEDLEQSAVVLDQYPAMAPTAAEMRKAAAELLAALEQEAGRG